MTMMLAGPKLVSLKQGQLFDHSVNVSTASEKVNAAMTQKPLATKQSLSCISTVLYFTQL